MLDGNDELFGLLVTFQGSTDHGSFDGSGKTDCMVDVAKVVEFIWLELGKVGAVVVVLNADDISEDEDGLAARASFGAGIDRPSRSSMALLLCAGGGCGAETVVEDTSGFGTAA